VERGRLLFKTIELGAMDLESKLRISTLDGPDGERHTLLILRPGPEDRLFVTANGSHAAA
jgi:hypothetical protein